MKIGIFTEYFYPTLGGITENIYHFAKECLRLGHDFKIVTGFRGEIENIDPEIKKRVVFIGRSLPIFYNSSSGRLTIGRNLTARVKKILDAEKFDIIHVHSPLFPTLPVIANIQANAPVVGTFHTCTGGDLFYYKMFRRTIQKHLDRMAGRIAVSECCAAENMRHFDSHFDVIPNGVDVDWWSNTGVKIKKFDDDKINILFIGRPDLRNGLDTLIAAFARIHPLFPETRLIIVGDGPLKFYFESSVPAEIKRAVHFEGAADIERPAYLATSHLFCFLPAIASFGITILEGMSAGKAMIASDIEAFRALVKTEESALLVPPKDEAALARAIMKLLKDENLRARLGKNAHEGVGKYDWKNVANMQLEYYKRILG